MSLLFKVFVVVVMTQINFVFAGLGNPNANVGGTFYMNSGSEPGTLNPLTSTDVYASYIHDYTLEGLMERNEDTYEFEPLLAESFTVSKDQMTFDFILRTGVKWHDGTPVTAEDVKFSFDVIFDPKYNTAPKRPYYEGIESVKIISPNHIQFKAKDKYFKNFEVAAGLTVVPKHIYANPKSMKDLNKKIVGTGPYILDEYQKGKSIILKRNSDWWGYKLPQYKGKYNFEKLLFRFVKEDNNIIEMLKKGTLDYDDLTPEAYMKKTNDTKWGTDVFKVKTINNGPKGYSFVGWNLQKEQFKDVKVRRALNHLMNRELMVEKFLFGLSTLATGPWYAQSVYASSKVKPITYDLQKAIALFKEAGWSDSDNDQILDKVLNGKKTSMSFTIMTANQEIMKYLTMFKEDAKKAGVDINLKVVEWNSFIKLLDERNFDAVQLGWGAGSVDLDPKQIWHSSSAVAGGSNFNSYKNPKVDKLIDEARLIMDKKKRIKVLQEVYELIAEDAPYLFMFYNPNTLYAYTKRVKRPKDTFNFVIGTNYWWFEK